jgi:hypothetical protein
MTGPGRMTAALALAALLMLAIHPVSGQQRPDRSAPAGSPSHPHEQHGTPKGWKFTWPKGDPVKGRAVFAKLECYSCHEVRGERTVVYVPLDDEGRFGERAFKAGRVVGGFVEMLEGLKAGERVVTDGSFFLRAEAGRTRAAGG